MASDSCKKPKPLYADLFKTPKPPEKPHPPASWSSTSSSNHSFLSFESSSSGFSTPPYSELGSSGSEDDGDFIEELTRQIAERMLLEEDEDEGVILNCTTKDSLSSSHSKDNPSNNDGLDSPIQVYEVKNQPPVQKPPRRTRRAKGSATGKSQKHKKGKGIDGYGSGLGMQAVYLGGYGSGIGSGSAASGGSAGTGVFLPRFVTRESDSVTHASVPVRKKSGCPIVLIPTRVLQVLELYHFNRACPKEEYRVEDEEKRSNDEEEGMMDGQLPKEWTY